MIINGSTVNRFKYLSKSIIYIAFPVMMQNMAFYIMSFINSAFIGHYSLKGLATINNVMFPFMMLFTVLTALAQGTTVLIAHSIGADDKKYACKIAENSIFYTQIISIGYFVFWLIFGKSVLMIMGVSDEIMESGVSFIRIFSLTFLTNGLNVAAGAIFQGIGKTKPIMHNTILRSAINIFLDYTLIFGHFGLPALGLNGAAISSVISVTLCNFLLFRSVISNGILDLSVKGMLKPSWDIYKKVFIFGAQAGLEFMLWTGAQVILLRMLNMHDELSAGLYGILTTLISLSFNLYVGIGTAAMTLVGYSCGANRRNEIWGTGNLCVIYSILLCIVVAILFITDPSFTISIFTKDPKAISQLCSLMPIVCLILFPKAINVVVGNAIRGTGDVRWMLMTQIAGTIIIICLSGILILRFRLGIEGLMYANFFDEFWRAVINYIRFFYKRNSYSSQCTVQNEEVVYMPR